MRLLVYKLHRPSIDSFECIYGLQSFDSVVRVKAIGGSRVKKTYHAYFVELIAAVSTLLTECQNSTRF